MLCGKGVAKGFDAQNAGIFEGLTMAYPYFGS